MSLIPQSYNAPQGVSSFTGADMKAVAAIDGKIKVFGELSTLSYSVHREKSSVLLLGRVNPIAFCRGPRTIAGTMIFTVFNREILEEFATVYPDDPIDGDFGSILIDQIPPFNITVTFVNEDGYLSSLVIYGIDIVDDGQTMSISDMIIENVKGYKARGLDLMWMDENGVWRQSSHGQRRLNSKAIFTANPTLGSDFAAAPNTAAIDAYKKTLFQIAELQKEIETMESQIVELGTSTYTDKQNRIDTVQQNIYRIESNIRTLQREAAQQKIPLNFTSRTSIIDKYLR